MSIYDSIGRGYTETRIPDQRIVKALVDFVFCRG